MKRGSEPAASIPPKRQRTSPLSMVNSEPETRQVQVRAPISQIKDKIPQSMSPQKPGPLHLSWGTVSATGSHRLQSSFFTTSSTNSVNDMTMQEDANVSHPKWTGFPLHELATIEACAGSAGLSAELKVARFDTVAVDHSKNQHRPKHSITLSSEHGKEALLNMVSQPQTVFVPMAPPGGTASRARERPIPVALKTLGAPEPKPLRSDAHPEGVPTLPGVNFVRVALANRIYTLFAAVVKFCILHGILFFIENPANSLLWKLPCILKRIKMGAKFVHSILVCRADTELSAQLY